MTLPRERFRAVVSTREFLRRLLNPKETPKVPKAIRTEAYWCLRHYPFDYHLEKSAEMCPEIWEIPESKYWICASCAKKQQLIAPKHAVTNISGKCGHCKSNKEESLTPVCDYADRKTGRKAIWD